MILTRWCSTKLVIFKCSNDMWRNFSFFSDGGMAWQNECVARWHDDKLKSSTANDKLSIPLWKVLCRRNIAAASYRVQQSLKLCEVGRWTIAHYIVETSWCAEHLQSIQNESALLWSRPFNVLRAFCERRPSLVIPNIGGRYSLYKTPAITDVPTS